MIANSFISLSDALVELKKIRDKHQAMITKCKECPKWKLTSKQEMWCYIGNKDECPVRKIDWKDRLILN